VTASELQRYQLRTPTIPRNRRRQLLIKSLQQLLIEVSFVEVEQNSLPIEKKCYKMGTQFGTQKGAERAVEAVDAVSAVRILLSKISAC
jgi:hypothetical protein